MEQTKNTIENVMSDYLKLINDLPYVSFDIKVSEIFCVAFIRIDVKDWNDMGKYYSAKGREKSAIAKIIYDMNHMFPYLFDAKVKNIGGQDIYKI